jgi:hypothetical protein
MSTAEEKIRAWLLEYAWMGTPESQAREVACIMSKEDDIAGLVDALTEKYVGQSWNPGGPGTLDEASEFALSSLYECHDGPHLETCPLHPSQR